MIASPFDNHRKVGYLRSSPDIQTYITCQERATCPDSPARAGQQVRAAEAMLGISQWRHRRLRHLR